MAAGSLRPHIVRVMSERRERPLSTGEIYEAVARTGVAGFDPRAKRDRNLVNRGALGPGGNESRVPQQAGAAVAGPGGPGPVHLQGAGAAPGPGPGAGVPGTGGGLREAAAAGAAFRGGPGRGRPSRCGWRCLRCSGASAPGAGSTCLTTCALRWTTSWRWPTTGLGRSGTCSCSAVIATALKGRRGEHGYRLKMAELRADNGATGVMVDEGLAALTGKRLAGYHRGELQA